MLNWIVIAAFGYFLGSTPSGLWICRKWANLDIREYGSRNTGATNVYRVLGWKAALIVFLLDFAKGALSVFIGLWITGEPLGALIGGLFSLIGHTWSFWMGFRGGRGVATGVGVLAALMPSVALVVFCIWLVIVWLTRYVSLGSVVAAAFVPILCYAFDYPKEYLFFAGVMALFVILRHKENIRRLLKGTEGKIGRISTSEEEKK